MTEIYSIPSELHVALAEVDPDYIRLHVLVGDGDFAGRTTVFEALEMPATLAASLAGFPTGPSDRREVVLGTFGAGYAGGAVRLIFRTLDRAGHSMIEAELEDEPSAVASPRTVTVQLPVEAAAVDRFIHELRALALGQRQSATLLGAA